MKKGRIFSVLIAIVMITMSSTGCFSDDNERRKKEEIVSIIYTVEISNMTNEEFVRIPVVQDYSDNQVQDLKILITEGSYKLEDTMFGYSYNITCTSNNVFIEITGEYKYSIPIKYEGSTHLLYLSLFEDRNKNGFFENNDFQDDNTIEIYLYNSETEKNSTVSLEFTQIWEDGQYEKQSIWEMPLKINWNKYYVKYEWNIYNSTRE